MNPRERLLLMIGVVLLGLVAFKYLIYDPQQATYNTLVAAREAARAELAKDQQILAREQQVRQEYARLSVLVKTMEAKLPNTKEIPPLLTSMEQYTRRVGVELERLHPGALTVVQAAPATTSQSGAAPSSAPTLPYSKMDVDLNLTGSFAQALTYLRDLRGLPRLVIVNAVNMNPQKYPQLSVGLQAEIYVLSAQGSH